MSGVSWLVLGQWGGREGVWDGRNGVCGKGGRDIGMMAGNNLFPLILGETTLGLLTGEEREVYRVGGRVGWKAKQERRGDSEGKGTGEGGKVAMKDFYSVCFRGDHIVSCMPRGRNIVWGGKGV